MMTAILAVFAEELKSEGGLTSPSVEQILVGHGVGGRIG